MSYHILHLLGPEIRVRVDHERFEITEKSKGRTSHVPIEDVAIVVSAAPDLVLTGATLRKMAERRIVYLVCNERYQPVGIFQPYYGVTSNETFRKQLEWTEAFRRAAWRRIIAAKIRCQSAALPSGDNLVESLRRFADVHETKARSDSQAIESSAARRYWSVYFRSLGEPRTRIPRSREGVNGLLDYGYAILRSAVLRSLACHGFISAVGLSHTTKPGGDPLADDLIEPLRGYLDLRLREWMAAGGDSRDQRSWAIEASGVLTSRVWMSRAKIRLLYAIDRMVESLRDAGQSRDARRLRFPGPMIDAARNSA